MAAEADPVSHTIYLDSAGSGVFKSANGGRQLCSAAVVDPVPHSSLGEIIMTFACRNFARLTVSILTLVTVTACGGGDSTPPPPPPPATHLLLTVPATASARASLPITVTALDASNNTATSYKGSVLITSSDGQALLPAVAVPLSNGGATFNVTLESSGTQTLTATDTVQASIAGTSPPINVSAAAAITITSGTPPGGVVGSGYGYSFRICSSGRCGTVIKFPLSASGGVGNLAWAWAAAPGSTLPPGLSLDINHISGIPATGSAGSYSVIVTVTDGGTPTAQASLPYTITIGNPPPPVIATLPGPQGATLNQPYSYQFQVSGFEAVTVSATGALPPGLAPVTATGLLAGTPTSANLYPITVHATDANGMDTPQAFTIGVFQHGFSPTGGMQWVRVLHTATLLASGQVFVTGGFAPGGWAPSSELFTPASGSFAAAAAPQVLRIRHTATLLCDLAALPCTNPKVLVAGGSTDTGVVGSAELYDPTAGTFTPTTGGLATARADHTATLLRSGKVLIAGGTADGTTGLATAELFDPATGSFKATAGSMTSARSYHTATLLADGRVLIAGGSADGITGLATAELFDPVAETFSAIASPMTVTRYVHTATLLPGGKVLIAGGYDASYASVAAAELYDPAAVAPAASFTATGALVTPRAAHTAVLLPSGQVLVVGGAYQSQLLQHAELYDPASGLFAPTGGMQTARSSHTLTSLGSSGKVLVVGGDDKLGTPLSTAEIYQ